MKKPVTTVDALRRALERLEDEWQLAAHVENVVRDRVDHDVADTLAVAHVLPSDPLPASPRGRGERVAVDVCTLWNEPPFGSDDAPLAALRERVASWPGVEAVGEPFVDTQLGAIWGFTVILRISQ